jgi:hypothetical protein
MEQKEKKEQEQNELNLLLQKGVNINIPYYELSPRKWWQFWKRPKREIKYRRIEFQEPTLAVLDRVSLEIVKLDIDEQQLTGENAVSIAQKIAYSQSRRMARIIAIFALGENILIRQSNGTYKEDEHALRDLTNIVVNGIKPSQMEQLFVVLTSLSNIGSFLSSIRLMCAARTTRERIE